MQKWEADLNTFFSDAQWSQAIRFSYTITHWELALKILHRWCLTPYRLAKIYKTSSSLCRRGCSVSGTLLHIFWTCNNFPSFYQKTFQLILEVRGIITPMNSALVLLNLGIEKFLTHFRGIVTNILLAAKLILTRYWKRDLAPNPSEVVNVIQQHYGYEKSLIPYLSSFHAFEYIWGMWASWYPH